MENWQVKKLIKSLEEATETLERLNEELKKATGCKDLVLEHIRINFAREM